jgi:hypothetical protein
MSKVTHTSTTRKTASKTATKSATKTAVVTTVDKPTNHNKRWMPADEQRMILSYAGGVSPEFIAKQLGRTTVSILGRLSEHGLVKFDKTEDAYFTVPVKLYQF